MSDGRLPAPEETHLAIEGITKSYGATPAVDGVSLTLARGEFVTLLGDSGCGKTTLLRIIGGFARPDGGRILRSGEDVTRLAASRRRIGFVFQSYALFPTKTVADNISFALDIARRQKAEIRDRVGELARLVEIEPLLQRFPHELSGGQQQRVALARAIASDPEILLLDEPMSALDARIRARLRGELKALISRLGVTTLYVTHDQEEALSLSDRVAVMRRGRIEQLGAPAEIYHRPASRFVAEFIGTANLIEGSVRDGALASADASWPAPAAAGRGNGTAATLLFRPEHIGLLPGTRAGGISGTVLATSFMGSVERLSVALPSGKVILVDRSSSLGGPDLRAGDPVTLVPDAARGVLFLEGSGR
ncbi:ABC transporter ATP-binding protein [Inquilinus sp.]|jgi:ABC-type Fe3+/spermidine/putrescine transport system ATPase subunit|uniref:ABC transporter ATP-binding protein n=1 Tax=Inquilinus sp. TaxID=1932117 RepID=UPI00378320A2